MQELFTSIIEMIANNPIASMVMATPIGGIVLWAAYKAVLKMALSVKNIEKIANNIDNMVDDLQKKDTASGKETRKKLIELFEESIRKLKESDGHN